MVDMRQILNLQLTNSWSGVSCVCTLTCDCELVKINSFLSVLKVHQVAHKCVASFVIVFCVF